MTAYRKPAAYRKAQEYRGRLPTGVPIPQPKRWKNDGWYAAGTVWESWVTNDNPSTTPPSGHTLTQLQHVQLR